MKKSTLILSLLLLLICKVSSAQNDSHNSNISFNMGLSNTSKLLLNIIGEQPAGVSVIGNDNPYLGLTYDVALGDVVSIGGTFNYNKSSITLNKGLANQVVTDGKAVGLGSRLIFHLMGENATKFDPYLGAGFTLLIWDFDLTPEPNNYIDEAELSGVYPLTLGMRYYFVEEFGVGAEYNTGKMNTLNLSVNLRF